MPVTSFTSFLASLVGCGAGVLLVIVAHPPSRKHWLSNSFMALGLAVGWWLGRYLFLGSNYVLLWMVIFGCLGGMLGMLTGRALVNRLKRTTND